ncbi:MAG: M48 family metallopeptidase [Cyanobacteria bacterium HKST-UBA04]|nr:M48 family metallopeptidase [Cyanobacteria bacterium HKST-UBA04]
MVAADARKTATGQIKGDHIELIVPSHWSNRFKVEATASLINRLQKQFTKAWKTVSHHINEGTCLVRYPTVATLGPYVKTLNETTMQQKLARVRLGHAKFSRLAQMNCKTRVMTVSMFSAVDVPETALRYLLLHELAHLTYADHSKRFWALVGQYVPDYKLQSKLIQAFHQVNVYHAAACQTRLENAQARPPLFDYPLAPAQPTYLPTTDLDAWTTDDEWDEFEAEQEPLQLQLL